MNAFETSNTFTSISSRSLLAVGLAALVVMGAIAETKSPDAKALATDARSAAALTQVAQAQSSASDSIDWSRVQVAVETQGASVAAYGN